MDVCYRFCHSNICNFSRWATCNYHRLGWRRGESYLFFRKQSGKVNTSTSRILNHSTRRSLCDLESKMCASCDNCKQPPPAATISAWFQDGCEGFAAGPQLCGVLRQQPLVRGQRDWARPGAAQVQVAAQSRQHGQGEVAEDHRGCWVRQASEAESVGGQTSLVWRANSYKTPQIFPVCKRIFATVTSKQLTAEQIFPFCKQVSRQS